MKVIMAKILEQTQLELTHPTNILKRKLIYASVSEADEGDRLWHEAAMQHFFEAYGAKDAIYDEI